MNVIVSEILRGVMHANATEIAAGIAAWWTFKDKAYAPYLALDQVTDTFGTRSLIGAGIPIATMVAGKGGSNGRRRRRHKGKKGRQ